MTMSKDVTIVVGLGEVGDPLYEILRQTYDCVGVDIDPVRVTQPCSVLHICIPYQIADFVGAASEYVAKYKPQFTVINSTVAPGTTRAVAASSRSQVVYSPVRGKHARMQSDMLRYRKFVGADDAKYRQRGDCSLLRRRLQNRSVSQFNRRRSGQASRDDMAWRPGCLGSGSGAHRTHARRILRRDQYLR